MSELRAAVEHQPRARLFGAVGAVGLVLTLVLLSTLLYVLWRDHEGKLHEAEKRVADIALGTDRLLSLQMLNLDRGLRAVAGDLVAPGAADVGNFPARLQRSIDSIVGRHGELIDMVIVDDAGRAISGGADVPTVAQWATNTNRVGSDGLIVGPPLRGPGVGSWAIPLAIPLPPGNTVGGAWVVARMRQSALANVAAGLGMGRDGVAHVFHRNGTLLARSRNLSVGVGGDYSRSELMRELLPRNAVGISDRISPVDGVRRIIAYRALPSYPLVVLVGVSRAEIPRPWYRFAFLAALLCVLYVLGWLLLVRALLQSNARQHGLLAALSDSREQLLEAQHVAGIGSWSVDVASGRVQFSPAALDIYGWKPGDPPLTVQSCLEQTHPQDRVALDATYARYIAEQSVHDARYRVVRPDGNVRTVIARGRFRIDAQGRQTLVGTVQDITDLAQAHVQVQETEAQYRLLFDRNPLPFWVFHRESLRILEANDAAASHYGYSREEFQQMDLADIRPPEDVADALAAARQANPEGRQGRIWRHVHKDGSIVMVAIHAADITFRGQPARLVLALDITERLQDQKRLESSERRFQLVARATSDAVYDSDISSGACWFSDSFDALFRYKPGQVPQLFETWKTRVHPDDWPRVERSRTAVMESRAGEWQDNYRFLRGDGSYARVFDRGLIERHADGSPKRMVGGMVDVSRQYEDEAELRLLRRAIEATENGIAIADARSEDLPLVYVNAAFERITGYTEAESIGRNCRFLQAGDRTQEGLQAVRLALAAEHEAHSLLRNYRKNGELFYNQLSLSPVRDDEGVLTHFVGALNDVTERQHHLDQLAYQASHDELTGLLNRSALLAGLERLLTVAADVPLTLLHVDINNFKLVNDSLGHEVGDQVLRVVAERLRVLVGAADRVGRMGGNEFVIILDDVPTPGAANEAITRVLEVLRRPIEALSTVHYLSLNAGIARFPEHGTTPDLLFESAGLATHEAKRRGHNQLVEYNPQFGAAVRDRQRLVSRLHEAMERNEFELFFQPLFDASSNRPIGLEALIRWRHPERGLVPPVEFIPVCEDSGLIVPLGRWVLREACRYHRLLVAAGWPELTIVVNVSALQFLSGELQVEIPALLGEFSMPRGILELELTESLVMENPESVIDVMRELHQYGVQLSIDDFGTGYSGMSYLHRLPVDKLKIDRSFVTNVDSDSHSAAICESILSLARSFELKVIAEGVETPAQLEWLRAHGCDQVQGYLLSRPAPFDEVMAAIGPAPAR
ncbi:MAG: EAL domain-containing protein [Arenimonas sp.]